MKLMKRVSVEPLGNACFTPDSEHKASPLEESAKCQKHTYPPKGDPTGADDMRGGDGPDIFKLEAGDGFNTHFPSVLVEDD
jgi:hypothetical protein